jgi:hypothetical protein
MAKLVIPEGFVLVTAKPRGKETRNLGDMLVSLKQNGDQTEVLKGDGERYSSILTVRKMVNDLVPVAEAAGYGLKLAWEAENPILKNAAACIERVVKGSPDALKYKMSKAERLAQTVAE